MKSSGAALLLGGAFFVFSGCAGSISPAGGRAAHAGGQPADGGWQAGLAAGAAPAGGTHPSAPPAAVIAGVPFLPQEEDTCGPSSLAMLLRFLGRDVQTAELVRETRTEGLKGTLITDLAAAARKRGIAAEVAGLDLPRLRERIVAGDPVILLVDLGTWVWSRPHYLLAYGWTAEGVVAHSGRTAGKVIPFSTLDAEWAKMGRLAIVVRAEGR